MRTAQVKAGTLRPRDIIRFDGDLFKIVAIGLGTDAITLYGSYATKWRHFACEIVVTRDEEIVRAS